MTDRLHDALGRANRIVALILGVALLLTVVFILADVILRKFSLGSLGGSDDPGGSP